MKFNILSIQNFPNVTISCFPNSTNLMLTWIAEMDELLKHYQDFLLIYPLFDPQYFEDATPEELKDCRHIAMQWIQDHRQTLKAKCRGIILPIKADNSDLSIIEIHREELESFYRIPTEILYHPQDLPMLSSALLYDIWDTPSSHIHKL